MNRRVSYLLEPRFRLCFVILLIFALISFAFHPALALIELGVVALVYFQFQQATAKRNREMMRSIENMMYDVNAATKDTLMHFPLPVSVLKIDTNEIIWYNDQFVSMTGAHEHLFETHLSDLIPKFDTHWILEGKKECPNEVSINGRYYRVYANTSRATDTARALMTTLYWMEVTEFIQLQETFSKSRTVVSLLLIDNYEELMKGVSESGRSNMLAEIDAKIAAWVAPADGIILKYDRNRYLFIFEEQYFKIFREEKFHLLDEVREVVSPNGVVATLSIGIGKDCPSFGENFKNAQLSIEMSLSRGGDQAVLRNKFKFEFFGGHSQELEKRTKVKSRVMANALAELIKDASTVLVMGHKAADNDSIGAAMGILCLARKYGKSGAIVLNRQECAAELLCNKIEQTPEYSEALITPEDALIEADQNTLLVVVDVNRPAYVESQPLLESVNKVALIDHHRRSADFIQNVTFNFHEPYASSACELITELLQQLLEAPDILTCEAEALLAGIVLDTKNFSMKTGVRTFEAAAFLRRAGADTVEVKRLFQNDLTAYVGRADIVKTVKMYRGNIAIAAYHGNSDRATAAQAADELLGITRVQASFVLYQAFDSVVVSARSLGNINVQVILEKLGGGGHLATAGAQIKDRSMEDILEELKQAIDSVLEDE